MLTLSPAPFIDFDLSALDRANLASGTLRHYKASITRMIEDGINPFDYETLASYANTLPSSGRSNLKAALAIVTRDYVKAKVSGAPIETIQRFLWLIDVVNDAIVIKQSSPERTPHWLSQEQVDEITTLALNNSMRDYIVLAVLLGAGLRREELETLTFDALTQIPDNGRMFDVLVIRGKGDKNRFVRISSLLASRLREWKDVTGGGHMARSIRKSGRMGDSLSAFGIFEIVRKYGALIGISTLAPHDCRRSYSRLVYENTGNIVLVKDYLGHEDTKTTLKYIGKHLNLDIPESAFPVRSSFALQVAGD